MFYSVGVLGVQAQEISQVTLREQLLTEQGCVCAMDNVSCFGLRLLGNLGLSYVRSLTKTFGLKR